MGILRAFSNGGGWQSTAALVLAAERKIDFPLFVFANVGEDSENPATLTYVREIQRPYAEKHGIELVEVQRIGRDGKPMTIVQHIHADNRSIGIPARMANGAPGNRSCTKDFKILVIDRFLRSRGASKESPAVVGLGISLDEFQRARTDSGLKTQTLEYPLIDLRLTRRDCWRIILDAGLPVPPKSSCFFCPFHTLRYWRELKRDEPGLYAEARDLEQFVIEKRSRLGKRGENGEMIHNDPVYFTSYGKPLDEVVGDTTQPVLFDDNCESGYCHV